MKSERRDLIFKALQDLGFRPELDSDGDIRLRYEGNTVLIGLPDDDG